MDIEASSIKVKVDGEPVSVDLSPPADGNTIEVSYTPELDLPEGEHIVWAYARNSFIDKDGLTRNFKDEIEHPFHISLLHFVIKYIRTTTELNMRTDPGIGYGIKATLEQGSIGRLVEDYGNGGDVNGYYWFHVHFGDSDGWCAGNRLEITQTGISDLLQFDNQPAIWYEFEENPDYCYHRFYDRSEPEKKKVPREILVLRSSDNKRYCIIFERYLDQQIGKSIFYAKSEPRMTTEAGYVSLEIEGEDKKGVLQILLPHEPRVSLEAGNWWLVEVESSSPSTPWYALYLVTVLDKGQDFSPEAILVNSKSTVGLQIHGRNIEFSKDSMSDILGKPGKPIHIDYR